MSETIIILDPTARPDISTIEAPRPAATSAHTVATVALLHNGNHKFDRVAARLAELMDGSGRRVARFEKGSYGRPAPPAMLAEIKEHAGAAVVGLAC